MAWLRRDEYLLPRLAVRGPLASWQAAGGKDTYSLARERARPMRQAAGAARAGTPATRARGERRTG